MYSKETCTPLVEESQCYTKKICWTTTIELQTASEFAATNESRNLSKQIFRNLNFFVSQVTTNFFDYLDANVVVVVIGRLLIKVNVVQWIKYDSR